MSRFNDVGKRYRLRYRVMRDDVAAVPDELEGETEIHITDAWGRQVAGPAFGEIAVALPQAIYCVRTRLGGVTRDESLVLDRNIEVNAGPLRIKTATPLDGSAYAQEYYSQAAESLSRTSSHPPIGHGPHSGGVLLFARAEGADAAGTAHVGRGILITDVRGRTLARLSGTGTMRDPRAGWAGLSARAAPGHYRLLIPGQPARLFPLHVFPHTQTQLFVFDRRGPLAETLKLFLRRGGNRRLFSASDPALRVVDIALDALGQLRPGVKDSALNVPPLIAEQLLASDVQDPMIGLLGAYLMLHEGMAVSPHLLQRLEKWLPRSPDVQVLRMVAGTDLSRQGLNEPPMMRYGLEIAVAAALETPSVAVRNGRLERLAARLLVDLTWTSWTPRVPRVENQRSQEPAMQLHAMPWTPMLPRQLTWVEHALQESGVKASQELPGLARQLRLPLPTVRRAFRTLQDAGSGAGGQRGAITLIQRSAGVPPKARANASRSTDRFVASLERLLRATDARLLDRRLARLRKEHAEQFEIVTALERLASQWTPTEDPEYSEALLVALARFPSPRNADAVIAITLGDLSPVGRDARMTGRLAERGIQSLLMMQVLLGNDQTLPTRATECFSTALQSGLAPDAAFEGLLRQGSDSPRGVIKAFQFGLHSPLMASSLEKVLRSVHPLVADDVLDATADSFAEKARAELAQLDAQAFDAIRALKAGL